VSAGDHSESEPDAGPDLGLDAGTDSAAAPPVREVTDPKAMRALAHPLRLALLEAMRTEGDLTASRAAELLGDSPGNMSWHLQTLARYGFVEDAGGGKGRSRPWRLVKSRSSFDTTGADPESAAAGQALEVSVIERTYGQLQQWRAQRGSYGPEWRRAAFISDIVTHLTADELAELSLELRDLFFRYANREESRERPPEALPVRLSAHGHPLPPPSVRSR
jgi:DNA-binding transcriptional ArsR family regulator